MRAYKDFFIWENILRLNSMINYLELLNKYIESYREENSNHVAEVRSKMMYQADKIEKYFLDVNMPPVMNYGSAVMGHTSYSIVQSFPFFVQTSNNPLNRGNNQLGIIKDMYDRAIGIYRDNTLKSLLNTLNPFAYIRYLVDILFSYILSLLMVNEERQATGVWKIIQSIINTLANLGAIWIFLKEVGWDKVISTFVSRYF